GRRRGSHSRRCPRSLSSFCRSLVKKLAISQRLHWAAWARSRKEGAIAMHLHHAFVRGRVLRGASSVGGVLALALIASSTMFAESANASCFSSSSKQSMSFPRSPAFQTQKTRQQSSEGAVVGEASIVGLWHIQFLSPDGEVVNEGFDQFHSDGTEILNDIHQPTPANGSGTICLGVFESKGNGTYGVMHRFW